MYSCVLVQSCMGVFFCLQVESVENICRSGCSRCVAQNYHRCRDAGGQENATTRSRDALFGDIIQKGKYDIIIYIHINHSVLVLQHFPQILKVVQ